MTDVWPEPKNEFQAATIADDQADDALDAGQQEQLDAAAATDARQDAEDAARDQVIADQSEELDELRQQIADLTDTDDGPPFEPPPASVPMALQRPVVAHMPITLAGLRSVELALVEDLRGRRVPGAGAQSAEYLTRLEQAYVFVLRVDEGLCTAWFMYGGSGDLPGWDEAWAYLAAQWLAGLRFVILYSPKKVTIDSLASVYAGLPLDQRPWLWLAYWQEPEGDFGLAGKPGFAAYRDGIGICATVAHVNGARNGTHLQTGWDLHAGNSQPYSGEGYLEQLLDGLDTEVDFCSESAFNFSGSDVLDDLVRNAVPYLRGRFPGRPVIFTSVGSSPAPGTQITAATCARGVTAVEHAWQQARDLGAGESFGHYAVGWHGSYYYGPGHPADTVTEPMLHRIYDELQPTA